MGQKLLDYGLKVGRRNLKYEVNREAKITEVGTHHFGYKLQCPHSNADIRIIHARQNGLLILCHEMWVRGHDFDQR